MNESNYRELFLFAAKAGSLEGYLFHRRKVEPLTVWVNNIDMMYRGLPAEVKKQVNPELAEVLGRVLSYGGSRIEPELKEKLEALRAATSKS